MAYRVKIYAGLKCKITIAKISEIKQLEWIKFLPLEWIKFLPLYEKLNTL